MCGKQTESPIQAKVVGSVMNVCSDCRRTGNVIEPENKAPISKTFYKRHKSESVENVVISNYGPLINSALARKNLNIQQLARIINIKESTLSKFMSGTFKPELDIARKIEDYLNINLVNEVESSGKSETMILDEMKKQEDVSENLADLILKQMKEKKGE